MGRYLYDTKIDALEELKEVPVALSSDFTKCHSIVMLYNESAIKMTENFTLSLKTKHGHNVFFSFL